jgi:ribosome-associated toxin RatA of RatAB toxin-antitoxin module
VQQLNTQHIFHSLAQNMIKDFKSRAQGIFDLLEKIPPPLVYKI